MKKIITATVLAISVLGALAQEPLVGTWSCIETTNGHTRTATWDFATSNTVTVSVQTRPRESPQGYIMDTKWRGPYTLTNGTIVMDLRDATANVRCLPPRTNIYSIVISDRVLKVTDSKGKTRMFRKDEGPNNTSDGIRQPADGSPKPSR